MWVLFPPRLTYLLVVGVSACRCTCGSRYPGLGALMCAGSLPVAACWGLDPWALSGLCLGNDMSRGLGLWLHGWICSGIESCRRGLWARCFSSLGLLHCGCWVVPLGLSPALLWGVAVVLVPLGFLCFGGPLDVYGSDLFRICPGSRGAGLWLLTLTIAYFYGKTLYTQARSHSDPQVLNSGVNKYTNFLY
ncbi:hypothetical protein AMECASPLE_036048 [Ameca splendens]|uniref:Uncharacterized protein n=1 Tax=Ameca splendens TaxID=208324 RepID=A0ABV0XKN9_9TELE